MCYDIKTKLETQLKRARRKNNPAWAAELEEKMKPYLQNIYHASGFTHPRVVVYTNEKPDEPQLYHWGLVPAWVKDEQQKTQLWNKTINARGETLFEKSSFKNAAKARRCLVYVDGFFEHHHFKGRTYPFYIYRKDNEPMVLAGIYESWLNRVSGELINSFSIVTTRGNQLLTKIHNNPRLGEPRMPVILDESKEGLWLEDTREGAMAGILKPFPSGELKAYTVQPIRGKAGMGNTTGASECFNYSELPLAI